MKIKIYTTNNDRIEVVQNLLDKFAGTAIPQDLHFAKLSGEIIMSRIEDILHIRNAISPIIEMQILPALCDINTFWIHIY